MKNKILLLIVLLLPYITFSQITVKMQKKNGVYYVPCKVNGNNLNFIFDTGAANVSITLDEAIKMYKKGLIDDDDFLGEEYYSDATGGISKGIKINLKLFEIDDKILLKNVEASVISNNSYAPLLLGQSVFSKIGKIEFSPSDETFTILNKKTIDRSITIDTFENVIFNHSGLIDNFCGFRLLQYEDSIIEQFGTPYTSADLESKKILKYNLSGINENADLYFTVSKLPQSSEEKQITAIQLSGKTSKFSVRGIKLGSPQSLIYENFGNPSNIKYIDSNSKEVKQLDYDNINISFVVDAGIVVSINVFYGNITESSNFKNEQLFNFKIFRNALENFTNEELTYLFAPDFEISATEKNNIYFKKGFNDDVINNLELKNFIKNKETGLKSLLNPSLTVENIIRLQEFEDNKIEVLYVLKVQNSPYINEIVLKKYFGRLLIWEIN